ETAQSLRALGVGLVLDLPVGCAASGYDPWAWPDSYVRDMSIGAPPDAFFTSGQCWGFPPPHPAAERASGYRTTRACLAHGLRHAAALRVDHVLGWSRLWWVPDGTPPDQGAYVRYPLDEILAVASLEAWNARSSLVGEDLGTVERRLRSTLTRHGVAGMDVAVFALEHQPTRRLRARRGGVALVD
ncbi:Glycoside hydrolase, family 77, partial [mine drainage metagenome]